MAGKVPDSNQPNKIEDYLYAFPGGMDSGTHPMLLQENTLAFLTNGTVRGDIVGNRPAFQGKTLIFPSDAVRIAFQSGLFQGAGYFKPDLNAPEWLLAQVSGRLYLFVPQVDGTVTVKDVTATNAGNDDPNSATSTQCWMFQAEFFMIVNDGVNLPVFFNGNTVTSTRSNYGTKTTFSTTVTNAFVMPAVGSSITATVGDTSSMVAGDVITLQNGGTILVQTVVTPTTVTIVNQTCLAGNTIIATRKMSWQHNNTQLPAGRMGAYVLGRVWMSLLDGRQFIAGDLVNGPSGTQANNYRDSVLNITENLYLAGGGNFTIPSTSGDIRAIVPIATLDASLGQGPVLVVTPKAAYTCSSPVDRTVWTNVQNPILTESMLTNAGLSQWSTVQANSDVLMRALEGIRSLILTRNDFQTWGNTTVSHEMLRVLPFDNRALLPWASAAVFNNRFLMTAGPTVGSAGVYHKGLVVINFDPQSSLRGKQAAVYDGLWLGLNTMQLVVGSFGSVERCFVFAFNTQTGKLELHEIMDDNAGTFDDNGTPIVTVIESPEIFRDPDPRQRIFKRLNNGELYIDNVVGPCSICVYYKPDNYPGWTKWNCVDVCTNPPTGAHPNNQPGFYPRVGLGEPSPSVMDTLTNRPMREAFRFQIKVEITGFCEFLGGRFECFEIPKPIFAKIPPALCTT